MGIINENLIIKRIMIMNNKKTIQTLRKRVRSKILQNN